MDLAYNEIFISKNIGLSVDEKCVRSTEKSQFKALLRKALFSGSERWNPSTEDPRHRIRSSKSLLSKQSRFQEILGKIRESSKKSRKIFLSTRKSDKKRSELKFNELFDLDN